MSAQGTRIGSVRLLPDEYVLFDVTSPLRTLLRPATEIIACTGICWALIGFSDAPPNDNVLSSLSMSSTVHNVILFLWCVFALWCFVLPVVRSRLRRFVITNYRVIIRSPGFRGDTSFIGRDAITGVRRNRNTLALIVGNSGKTLSFARLPKAAYAQSILSESLSQSRGTFMEAGKSILME